MLLREALTTVTSIMVRNELWKWHVTPAFDYLSAMLNLITIAGLITVTV